MEGFNATVTSLGQRVLALEAEAYHYKEENKKLKSELLDLKQRVVLSPNFLPSPSTFSNEPKLNISDTLHLI